MADTQVFAAQRYQRARTEPETLGPDRRGLYYVETGFQAAVRLQSNFVPQIVGA